MRTSENQYKKIQGRVLRVLAVCLLFCVFCALISNISAIKNAKIENGFAQNGRKIEKLCINNHPSSRDTSQGVYVHIGGSPIGISIKADGLIVVDRCSVETSDGAVYPSARANIKCGDVIEKVNGESIKSLYALKNAINEAPSKHIALSIIRGKEKFETYIDAVKDNTGAYKLGLALKEDVGGVGTLTFVTQSGEFGALGHHVCDGESGLCGELNEGNIYKTSVDDVVKGEKGKAGGLIAEVNRLSSPIGEIQNNTDIGLYGKFKSEATGDLYRIALKGEAKMGKAQVLTTIDGSTPKFYDIEIVKVVSQSDAKEKGMVISVCDKELIAKTGGIVQGMSGSPIVQNGILIGAITHVFVQDPTRGYAVHSRFMYDYATQNTWINDNNLLVA